MNDITYAVSVDVNNPIIPYNVYVASVLDSNVRYLEITLYQNGNVIALSNTATATAALVTDDVLIDDSVNCTISDNIITVPLEDLQRHGNLDVQVTVTEGTKVLAIPFPIQVRVTPNIAENAQIDENSLGSYAEVVHEIAEARGAYTTLHDAIAAIESGKEDKSNKAVRITSSNIGSGTNYPTVAAVAQYLGANYYNKNDIDDSTYTKSEVDTALAAKANAAPGSIDETNLNFTPVKYVRSNDLDECINSGVLYRVHDGSAYQLVICSLGAYAKTQYMFTQLGTVKSRTMMGDHAWSSWSPIGKNENIADDVVTIEEQLIDNIVTDIGGKEDKSNKVTAIGAESTDTQYPSAKAVYNAIQTAIGGVENGSY